MGVAGVSLIPLATTLSYSLLHSALDSVPLRFRCHHLWSPPQDALGVWMTSHPVPPSVQVRMSLPEGRRWPRALVS